MGDNHVRRIFAAFCFPGLVACGVAGVGQNPVSFTLDVSHAFEVWRNADPCEWPPCREAVRMGEGPLGFITSGSFGPPSACP